MANTNKVTPAMRSMVIDAMNVALKEFWSTINKDLWSFGLDLVSAAEAVLQREGHSVSLCASTDEDVCEVSVGHPNEVDIKFDVYATKKTRRVVEAV